MEWIKFNSQSTEYKSPYGAVPCGETVRFNIKIKKSSFIKNVSINILKDNKENPYSPLSHVFKMTFIYEEENYNIYSYEFTIPDKPSLYFYYFSILFEDGSVQYYGNSEDVLGGRGKIYLNNPKKYQITTYYPDSKTPDWYKDSIIYQIFPDRFYNGNACNTLTSSKKNTFIYSNWYDKPMYIKDINGEILRWDFYGGNLKGIIKKLDYLEELGINLIYLNPIFKAASNHRYDTGDYMKIDEVLGTEEDFKELISLAKDRGINIILDGVFNHTGRDSKYFNKFNNYDSTGAYNSKDSEFYDWYTFYNFPDDYDSWWGIKDLPCVNEMSSSFINYIIKNEDSVIAHWMKCGIKGWRLDVADELPGKFLEALRKRCHDIDEEAVVLGEVWEDATNKISYDKRREYMSGRELDSVTNYSFRNILLDYFSGKINTEKVIRLFESMKENYPKENFYALTNILSTHDVERIITMCKDKKIFKLMVVLQMTFPGVPLIYYGDEVGVEGGKDPDNRRTYPWGKEDEGLLKFYKILTGLRKNNKVLSRGEFSQRNLNDNVYSFVRSYEEDKIIVLVNRSRDENYNLEFYEELKNIENLYIYNTNDKILVEEGKINISIEPLEYLILTTKKY